jgi:Heavy-metal resistance
MSALSNLKNRVPALHSRWWTGLLALSLMANLLVGGLIAGRILYPHDMDRMMRDSFVQLVPRKFFVDLPAQRRKELVQFLRDHRGELKALRETSQTTLVKFADALENYDAAMVKSVIDSFTTGSESLAAKSGAVVTELVMKLTPEERKKLAEIIRERDNRKQK